MDEDRTSLSGTQSNDTIIELTGATNSTQQARYPAEDNDTECVGENDTSTKIVQTLDDAANQDLQLATAGPKTPTNAPPVVTPGLLILDLLKLKKRKIGHRRVNEEGEITFKKIQTSWIIGSIQLGIGYAIGSLASKPERDLLMMDFTIVETTSFPKDGSNMTPAHHFSDFKFRAYAPVAFRYFRDLFGIRPDDFLLSLCNYPMVQLTNPGASGSIFYVTDDDNFIIKTVDHREAEFLQKLLPGYYMNINQNPRTLLPKFFGLYCYQCSNKNVRLVVMNNLLPSFVRLHEKYDLKGSTYKRKASKQERRKTSPTYKDLDYLERHPDGIFLEPETYGALVHTLRRDCRVLESFKIMDYSLLVGIHNLDISRREKEERRQEAGEKAEATSPHSGTAGTSLVRSKSMNRQRLAAFSTAMESIRADVEVPESDEDVPPGGIPAKNSKGERLLLFLGIIDILQSFILKKKLEHTLKAIVHDGDTVSVHRPGFYAQRFLDFMSNTVFKKTPSPLKHTPSKRKGAVSRKASAAERDPDPKRLPQKSRPEASENLQKDAVEDRSSDSENSKLSLANRNNEDLEGSDYPQDSDVEVPPRLKAYVTQERSNPVPPRTIALQGGATKPMSVTWAETEVVTLSQVIIETESISEAGTSTLPTVTWTPPHSIGGSTPTHTEGTPSLTESSPSPTTPVKSINKSVDSLEKTRGE